MNKPVIRHIGVAGAGAWGTALAAAFVHAGHKVTMWALEGAVVSSINEKQQNIQYLKGIKLPRALTATTNIDDLAPCDRLVLVPPAQHLRALCQQIATHVGHSMPIIVCSKGVEQGTLKLMSEVVQDILPKHPVAVLSGPSFASEVARKLPTAVTIACEDVALAGELAIELSNDYFRIYSSGDIVGAQVGNAVKNVVAIACGIAHGRALGHNAIAAIITRGLAEMRRLGKALGGRTDTMMGLAGAGDIILTCTSTESRNMSMGAALGEGESLEDIMQARGSMVTEGVHSAKSLHDLAAKLSIDMPICEAVYRILYEGADIDSMAKTLMSRSLKEED